MLLIYHISPPTAYPTNHAPGGIADKAVDDHHPAPTSCNGGILCEWKTLCSDVGNHCTIRVDYLSKSKVHTIWKQEKGAAKNRLLHPKQIRKRIWLNNSSDFHQTIQTGENALRQLGAGHIVVDALTNETDSVMNPPKSTSSPKKNQSRLVYSLVLAHLINSI